MKLEDVVRDLRHGKSITRKNDPVNRVITFDCQKMVFVVSAFGQEYDSSLSVDLSVFDLVARDWIVVDSTSKTQDNS